MLKFVIQQLISHSHQNDYLRVSTKKAHDLVLMRFFSHYHTMVE